MLFLLTDVPDLSYSTSEDEDFYDACGDECLNANKNDRNSESEEFSPVYQRYCYDYCFIQIITKKFFETFVRLL